MYRNVVGSSTAQGVIYRGLFMDTADFWSCFWDCHHEHCPFSLVHALLAVLLESYGLLHVSQMGLCCFDASSIHAPGIGNILWISSLSCPWFCCSSCICETQRGRVWAMGESLELSATAEQGSAPVNLNSLHTLLSPLFSMLLSIKPFCLCGFSYVLGNHGHDAALTAASVCECCFRESIWDYGVPHFLPVDREYFFFCVMFTLRKKNIL